MRRCFYFIHNLTLTFTPPQSYTNKLCGSGLRTDQERRLHTELSPILDCCSISIPCPPIKINPTNIRNGCTCNKKMMMNKNSLMMNKNSFFMGFHRTKRKDSRNYQVYIVQVNLDNPSDGLTNWLKKNKDIHHFLVYSPHSSVHISLERAKDQGASAITTHKRKRV
ncbi:hypothetical protein ES708_09301 [subsurface metagenome]